MRISKKPKTVNGDITKNKLIKVYHESPQSGHFDIKKCLATLKHNYILKNMKQDRKTIFE